MKDLDVSGKRCPAISYLELANYHVAVSRESENLRVSTIYPCRDSEFWCELPTSIPSIPEIIIRVICRCALPIDFKASAYDRILPARVNEGVYNPCVKLFKRVALSLVILWRC
jgi:hypothetical protein